MYLNFNTGWQQPAEEVEAQNLERLRRNIPETEEDIPILCRNYIEITQRLDWVLSPQSLSYVQDYGRQSLENLMGYWNTYLSMTRGQVELPGFPMNSPPRRRKGDAHMPSVNETALDLARTCPLYIGTEQRMTEMEYPLVRQLGTEAKARDQLKRTSAEYSGLVNQKATLWASLQNIALYRLALGHFLHRFQEFGRGKFR